jgi:hypothetical protein
MLKNNRYNWILSLTLAILLLYPALMYYDLEGMGGYDGFVSPEMMVESGAWASSTSSQGPLYYALAGAAVLWLLSMASLSVAIIRSLVRLARRQPTRA